MESGDDEPGRAVIFKIRGMEEFYLCPIPLTFDNLVLALA